MMRSLKTTEGVMKPVSILNPAFRTARVAKRSPLKEAPLRVAGESTDTQINEVLDAEVLSPLIIAMGLMMLAGVEWCRYYADVKPHPWLFSFAALVGVVYAAFQIRRGVRLAKSLKLGRSGERAVAEYLERFRAKGYIVFHDIPTGDANIDHLLIGPRGIYTIETKTISKPVRGDVRVVVKDDGVFVDGHRMDGDPVVQAKAQARWVRHFIEELGYKKSIQPVVVFPRWFVEPFDTASIGVWVLEPKALEKFIDRQKEVLTRDEVRAIAKSISDYIRRESDAMSHVQAVRKNRFNFSSSGSAKGARRST
jgi:hypothetical protein